MHIDSNEVPGTSTSTEHFVARPVQPTITRYISKPVGAHKRNIIDE